MGTIKRGKGKHRVRRNGNILKDLLYSVMLTHPRFIERRIIRRAIRRLSHGTLTYYLPARSFLSGGINNFHRLKQGKNFCLARSTQRSTSRQLPSRVSEMRPRKGSRYFTQKASSKLLKEKNDNLVE